MLPTLQSERLTLRPWTADDAEAVFDLYSRWEVMRFLGTNPAVMTEPVQAEAKIATWNALPGPLHGIWAIVPHGEDRPIGTALLKLLPHSGSKAPSPDTEVGWHLHPDAWGRGYATEAGGRLLAHAWSHDLEQVFAVTYPENTASRAVRPSMHSRNKSAWPTCRAYSSRWPTVSRIPVGSRCTSTSSARSSDAPSLHANSRLPCGGQWPGRPTGRRSSSHDPTSPVPGGQDTAAPPGRAFRLTGPSGH